MGCCGSVETPLRRQDSGQLFSPPTAQAKALDKADLRFTSSAFVFRVHESLSRRYAILGKLGEGAYGTVWKAQHKPSGQLRAIKTLSKGELPDAQELQMKREVGLLRRLDHPNIIQIHEVIEDYDSFHIITEYCGGGDLLSRTVDRVGETAVAGYMLQLLSAVAYCHKRHIVHRDIKPENLLLITDKPESLLKVIDFGTSSKLKPRCLLSSVKGTIRYLAPEVLSEEYNEKCDIWSCGIVLFALFSTLYTAGHTPYDSLGYDQTLARIKEGDLASAVQEILGISEEAKRFLARLLTKEVEKRPSAAELLRDEWLNAYRVTADSPVLKNTEVSFRSLKGESKFRQAALQYITWHLTPNEKTEQLTRLFIALDADRDGRLSIEDLRKGLANPEEASDLLAALDMTACGFVEYHDFLQATLNWPQVLSAAVLRSAFQAFDRNGNGRIDTTEVKLMLQGEQEVATPVWDDVLQDADKDGNGVVDYQEFVDFMVGE